jgi:hypothetical protein
VVPVVITEGTFPALMVAGVAGDKKPVVALIVYTETLLERTQCYMKKPPAENLSLQEVLFDPM